VTLLHQRYNLTAEYLFFFLTLGINNITLESWLNLP